MARHSSSSEFVSLETDSTDRLDWPKGRSGLATRFLRPRELGRGGFGRVYRVNDDWLDVEVAVKISSARDRLVNEVQRLRTLPKQYFVQTFDYGRQDLIAYYSMELLFETDDWYRLDKFAEVMERHNISQREQALYALLIIQNVCYGLTYLHNGETEDKEYFHGDLKPQNIFFNLSALNLWKTEQDHEEFSLVKIIDLGVSRRNGEVAGGFTRGYAPPEQIAGRPCGLSVDTYSIGRILLRLLGESEAGIQSVSSKLKTRVKTKFGDRISADVIGLLERSLERSPKNRGTCEEIGDTLHDLFSREYYPPVWRIIAELSVNGPEMKRLALSKEVEKHVKIAAGRKRLSAGLRDQAKLAIDYAIKDGLIQRGSRGALKLA